MKFGFGCSIHPRIAIAWEFVVTSLHSYHTTGLGVMLWTFFTVWISLNSSHTCSRQIILKQNFVWAFVYLSMSKFMCVCVCVHVFVCRYFICVCVHAHMYTGYLRMVSNFNTFDVEIRDKQQHTTSFICWPAYAV